MSFIHIFSWLPWLIAAAWLWKAIEAARGIPNIPEIAGSNVQPAGAPSLTVIVPARNEEANVADCLHSLLGQDYSNFQIIAVNDRSTDKTGAIMDKLGAEYPEKLRILHIDALPSGWLGKTHAMAVAAQDAATDYLLFTDADVLFQPDALRRSLACAVASEADHFVTLPTPVIKSHGEGMLLGFLQTIGLWITRPWRVSDPDATWDFVGIGAFCLMRSAAYKRIGGFEYLRFEILEDLNLAQRIKRKGLRQVAALSPSMVRVHWASGAMGVVRVMTKNLFALFQFRIWLLLPACVGIAALFLLPVVFLFWSATILPGVLAMASIVWLYRLAGKLSGISSWYAALFPVSALLFIYSLLRSMFITLKQGGVNWRGTFYPLSDLRKNNASGS
ncbi:MAG TPA: glycosyltransferase [Edaphobacter sp.]|nr:glycosyltransferase [Edaphobacter sp.]